ncbi:MAG: ABC transporter substrate-binding protein [Pseudomonadota bacterium]
MSRPIRASSPSRVTRSRSSRPRGDGPDIDALISGSVDFTISTPNRLFTAYEQGKPLLAVMNMANRMGIECAMNKAMAEKLGVTEATPLEQKLKALKGQTVAGTRPGAFTYLLLVNYAKRVGLVPQQDLQIIGVGGPNSMLPALENGQVAVACTGSPMPEFAVSRGKAIAFSHNLRGDDPAFDDFLFELLYARPIGPRPMPRPCAASPARAARRHRLDPRYAERWPAGGDARALFGRARRPADPDSRQPQAGVQARRHDHRGVGRQGGPASCATPA